MEKDSSEPYYCLSDFIAPKGSGVKDYMGMCACSAGHGLEKVIAHYKEVSEGLGRVCLRCWPWVGGVIAHHKEVGEGLGHAPPPHYPSVGEFMEF